MHIKIINPNTTAAMTANIGEAGRAVAAPGATVEAVSPPGGPVSIEGRYDDAVAAIGVLETIRGDAPGAVSAYVIACFGDPGLDAAREATAAPVLGIAEAAMCAARFIAPGFSVVTTLARTIGISRELVHKYGMEVACRSIRATGLAVLDLEDGDDSLIQKQITDESRRAISEDHAEAIVLGCAGMADIAAAVEKELDIPVIDGVAAAVKFAEALVALNLRTAKHGEYAFPLAKAYSGALAHLQPGESKP